MFSSDAGYSKVCPDAINSYVVNVRKGARLQPVVIRKYNFVVQAYVPSSV